MRYCFFVFFSRPNANNFIFYLTTAVGAKSLTTTETTTTTTTTPPTSTMSTTTLVSEVVDRRSSTPNVICQKAREVGPCRAYYPRWLVMLLC